MIPDDRPEKGRSRFWPAALAAGFVVLAAMAWLTRPSLTLDGSSRFGAAVAALLIEAWLPLLWLGAAYGIGATLLRSTAADRPTAFWLATAIGVAAMLWIDAAFGALGWLQAGGGIGAWAVVVAGLALAAGEVVARSNAESPSAVEPRPSNWAMALAAPGVAVLLTAALSAPGWLWASEAHGYDVLEYHLQLPTEWLEIGRLASLEHNVYSFLPSYMEAAYYHLSVMAQPFADGRAGGAMRAAVAAQLLHAFITLLTGIGIAKLAVRWVAGWAAGLAGALAVCVPWTIVTGSMAYNEMTVALLVLAGFALATDGSMRRDFAWAAILGLALGAACGAKLTAVASAVPVGAIALMRVEPRRWPILGAMIAAAGFASLLPWLIRNGVATGWDNPLFPFALDLLGAAHWSAEQAARWSESHDAEAGIAGRFAALWREAFRHTQWAGMWMVGTFGAAAAIAAARDSRRRATVEWLVVITAQIAFWLTFTHLQSRFLTSSLIPLTLLFAIGCSALVDRMPVLRRPAVLAGALLVAGVGWRSMRLYERERGGAPAAFIDAVALRTGAVFEELPRDQRIEAWTQSPETYISHLVPPDAGVYLLGDATPFYILRPVIWHTTYDRSPLGEAIAADPDDPASWAAALRAEGVDYVLVNYAELHRLGVIDRWYDPHVTIERVNALMDGHATLVQAWPGQQRALYRLHSRR